MLLIIHTNPAHMGDFLLAHLNKTHLCIHKVPKKFRFLFKYKRSRGRGGGVMSLVGCATTVETFSWVTIPPWISLIIWIKHGNSNFNNVSFLLILNVFILWSVSGRIPSLCVPIFLFRPGAWMGAAFHSVNVSVATFMSVLQRSWGKFVYCDSFFMYTIFLCMWQSGA